MKKLYLCKKIFLGFIIHDLLFIIRKSKGFTLIELLVVMVVLMATGIVIGAILFSSLRIATKASILTTARQNGDYAIAQMVKTIRNAKTFGGVATCIPGSVGCNDVWQTNCSQDVTPIHYTYVKITGPDDGEVIYSCASQTISFNNVSLLDTNSVIAQDCYFRCFQTTPFDSPTIGINFSIVQSRQGGVSESNVSLPFSTSVRMRNSLR